MTRSTMRPDPRDFRRRFLAGERLIGTLVKTPTGHATEIIGNLGFDFVVIDEEHAPFDRQATDAALIAARAAHTAGLVRVASSAPWHLQAALDCGATGVVVPHVANVANARDVVAACRYRGGRRGFSSAPRAGGYGTARMWDHVDAQDAETTVVAMIEDAHAIDAIDEIARVEGLDGFFVGRGDLTVSLGASTQDAAEVAKAVERIILAAREANKPACVMVAEISEAEAFIALGATVFIVLSDQGLMRKAAARALDDFSALGKTGR
jgi:staphyloferrin B biosynthesis citrate synthase